MPTEFQMKVWRACSRIPKGRVSTYKQLGKAVHCKSFQAVGNALNKSPGLPKVPCHRVVKSNGRVGGFAWGEKEKIRLLEKEGVHVEKGIIVDFNFRFFEF